MAQVDVYNMAREKVGEMDLPDAIFAAPVKEHLFWEAVKWQQAGRRAGTAQTKTRKEIHGSTRKLFKQKGTGRARRGDIKSPLLRKGGTVFGPHPRDFGYTLPRKVKRAALICALSKRCAEKGLWVLDKLELPAVKTKQVVQLLKVFALENALIVDEGNRSLYLAGRNLPTVKVLMTAGLNVFDVLKYDHLVLTRQAVAALEGRLAK
jgi:large subunit ribosomal protein L4